MSGAETDGGERSPIGLRIVHPDGAAEDIFGPPFTEELSAASADMADGAGAARPGARKVGADYLVRVPLPGGGAHLWRMSGEGKLSAADIRALAGRSAAITAQPAPTAKEAARSGDSAAAIIASLAQTPSARGGRGARLRLEAIGKATGWRQPAAVAMRRGRAKAVRFVDQFGNAKAPSIRIFAEAVAAKGAAAFSTAEGGEGPDKTEIAAYLDEHRIDGFALALPEGDGPALYAEGVIAAADIIAARNAFAIASDARSKKAGRSWRPVLFGLAALAAAAFLAMPTTLDVSAPAVIEPAESEMVVAPYEARLISLSARVGDRVAKGAPLGQMRSSDLAEAEKRAALDDMLERLAAQEALASGDYAKYQLAEQRAAIAAFRAEQGARRLSDLSLAAPGDGRVAWAIPESRIGELIPAGEPMAEIQYGEAVRARLSIPVADGALVSAGMTGSLVVSGLAGASFPVKVLEDPIMSEDRDGRRALSVLAAVEAPADHELLKGLTGFARLDAGTAPRIWAWARPAADYLRFAAWKYLGLHL